MKCLHMKQASVQTYTQQQFQKTLRAVRHSHNEQANTEITEKKKKRGLLRTYLVGG